MFGTEIIEVGIGLAFAYFAISVICSGIVEAGVKITKLRAKHMKQALGELLDDKNYTGFVKELYEHHLIAPPLREKLGEPTSISAKNFALAVLDIVSNGQKATDSTQFELIKERILTMKNEKMRNRMLIILNSGTMEYDSIRQKIEEWFNESMEAVTEWYRKRMRAWVTIVSILVVGAMNADTIHMTSTFWNDDELRTATVNAASDYLANYDERAADGTVAGLVPTKTVVQGVSGQDSIVIAPAKPQAVDTNLVRGIKTELKGVYNDINATKVLPIGWVWDELPGHKDYTDTKSPILWWLLKLIGLTLTIGAVSLGSTYWYSQLKSLLNLRIGGKGPATPDTGIPTPQAPAQVTVNLTTSQLDKGPDTAASAVIVEPTTVQIDATPGDVPAIDPASTSEEPPQSGDDDPNGGGAVG